MVSQPPTIYDVKEGVLSGEVAEETEQVLEVVKNV